VLLNHCLIPCLSYPQATVLLRAPFGAIRRIYRVADGKAVQHLDELEDGVNYAAASTEPFKNINYSSIVPMQTKIMLRRLVSFATLSLLSYLIVLRPRHILFIICVVSHSQLTCHLSLVSSKVAVRQKQPFSTPKSLCKAFSLTNVFLEHFNVARINCALKFFHWVPHFVIFVAFSRMAT
jgi:hypothetical protein